jgi:hypothetical protein
MHWIFDNEIDWVIQGRAHFGSPDYCLTSDVYIGGLSDELR